MSTNDYGPQARQAKDLLPEIDRYLADIKKAAMSVFEKREGLIGLVHDAEWHARALGYHFGRIVESYMKLSSGISRRANSDEDGVKPSQLIMYAPEYQHMMFDLYAFLNIGKISLDSLRKFLRPVFATEFGQIPKSIADILKGSTDCPVYIDLKKHLEVKYLCDLRNCVVHFRSLTTSDNLIAVNEGLNQEEAAELDSPGEWLGAMARAVFRFVDKGAISVNMYLPDKIFVDLNGNKKLASFTYSNRFNILTFCRASFSIIVNSLLSTFKLLVDKGTPKFSWAKSL